MSQFSVLVVDDEVDFVETLLKRLRRRGVECDGVHCGRDAMEKITHHDFDVVLLDMKLPDGDGNDLLREIRKLGSRARVVILSGFASAQAGREGLGCGAFDYLIKPVEMETLYEKLKEASSEQAGLCQGEART
ncbi:MAG: response regulator [Thermoleophilia bacterium]|nr:response regulator [Thermoleophilia bacterium]